MNTLLSTKNIAQELNNQRKNQNNYCNLNLHGEINKSGKKLFFNFMNHPVNHSITQTMAHILIPTTVVSEKYGSYTYMLGGVYGSNSGANTPFEIYKK